MFDNSSHLILYKTPSNEILRNRKEFYGLWKRLDDETMTWLNRVQCQIDRCDFPPILSREYLLIDKFVCELDDDARELIQSVNTWTLMELMEYFKYETVNSSYASKSSNTPNKATSQNQQQTSIITDPVKCEFDGYEYTERTTNIEIVNEENALTEMKSQPSQLGEVEPSIAHSSIYAVNKNTSSIVVTAKTKPNSVIIDEESIDRMEFESGDYKFSINDAVAVAIDKIYSCNRKQLDLPLEGEPPQTRRAKEKRFACDLCNKSFTLFKSLNAHKKVHHEIPPYACDICKSRFALYSSIKSHMIIHTRRQLYSCDICNKSYPSEKIAIEHKIADHDVILLHACDQCDKTFNRLCNLEMHKMIVHKEIQPNDDSPAIAGDQDLEKHLRLQTVQETYSCDQCNKSFRKSSTLSKHKRSAHQPIRPNDFEAFDESLPIADKHEQVSSIQKGHQCDQCDKLLSKSTSLRWHKKTVHQGFRPHACVHCDKRFPKIFDLKRHLRSHTDEKPYNCDQCNKSFSEVRTLSRHKKSVHQWTLSQDSYFNSTTQLKKHSIKSTRKKSYTCTHCDNRSFHRLSNLKRHIKSIHKRIDSYACQLCDKLFTSNSDLETHSIVHTQEKNRMHVTNAIKRFLNRSNSKCTE